MKKTIEDIELVKGTIPKKTKETYDWEAKPPRQFEPWHPTTLALILDVLVLVVYTFVNFTRNQLLTIGYSCHFLAIACIVLSYVMLKKQSHKWTQATAKFSGLLNVTAIFITVAVTCLTFMLT
ncbi:MAG: hypothetical protein ACRCTE_12975 [Cellulosilyticaceae bacterium]